MSVCVCVFGLSAPKKTFTLRDTEHAIMHVVCGWKWRKINYFISLPCICVHVAASIRFQRNMGKKTVWFSMIFPFDSYIFPFAFASLNMHRHTYSPFRCVAILFSRLVAAVADAHTKIQFPFTIVPMFAQRWFFHCLSDPRGYIHVLVIWDSNSTGKKKDRSKKKNGKWFAKLVCDGIAFAGLGQKKRIP